MIIITPLKKARIMIIEVQPGINQFVKILVVIIPAIAIIETIEISKPMKKDNLKGQSEKDVIALTARLIIFFKGYFVSPAKRA
jgi:hypothetical protein